MDEWGVERSVLFNSIEKAVQTGLKYHQNQRSGQFDLLHMFEEQEVLEDYVSCAPWKEDLRLSGEKETLGFYLKGHPAECYLIEFKDKVTPIFNMALLNLKKHPL